ncbi:uncharacterized protein At2g24330-like isoform X2 [Diospyros lotus]|uniref:uncharacterized protein At2g24330-like isoform X2 n=1 Tax=Diospyros lotus TaxID=55363 RepID=UPI0022592713|nr:uncharacterized protein At2g24330-like isoform X2 [Diospyros lotus]
MFGYSVVAVGYAIMTTRSLELKWKMRAFRVLPMFIMPGLSYIIYSALVRFTRMCDRKDQKALDKLRAERQAIIDELKEKTNYYTTQQLIQRYDPDPAAKAAAATVLASKLGAESGLKVYVGDESKLSVPTGKSNDVELVQSNGLRNRKELQTRYVNTVSDVLQHSDKDLKSTGNPVPDISEHNQLVFEHDHPGSTTHDGGWVARIAALLVGEDPSQSYALICGHCRMHNGLARKEDFAFITYYCPHCNALNRSKQGISSPNYPKVSSSTSSGNPKPINSGSSTKSDRTASSVETTEKSDSVVPGESGPAN